MDALIAMLIIGVSIGTCIGILIGMHIMEVTNDPIRQTED